jgi:hypothetical protein
MAPEVERRALDVVGKPPEQPKLDVSQSTKNCSDKSNSFPVLIA